MNDAVYDVLLIAGALTTITVAAMWIKGIVRVFLIAQAVYWSLSYVVRPIVLLWVQPQPTYGDSVADPRLSTIGYDHGISSVLQPVVFGLWTYATVVVGYTFWIRRRSGSNRNTVARPRSLADKNFIPTLWTVFGIGMVGRALLYATGSSASAGQTQSSSPILSFITLMAVIGTLGLIVFLRFDDPRMTFAVIGCLTVMELLWTVAVESKTPIMGAALAIAVRFALTGWTRVKLAAIAAISVVGIAAFGWLQSFKASDVAKSQSAVLDASYPPILQPFLSILRRFDLLEAATDSYYMGGRPWLTMTEVAHNVIFSFVPEQLVGGNKFHAGTAWANEVRGASVDMTNVSVSLAEGNINEGFVLGGYPGVVVGVILTFVLLLSCVWALQTRHIFLISLGLLMIEVPVFFERGIFGSAELLGKSVQAAVLVWIVYLAVGEVRRRPERFSTDHSSYSGTQLIDTTREKE
ncbi:hypothetical protein O1W68_13360 [Rhodococcus sp. H36-A4]|uniref:hypothetical protein n=1 Tax=Rhodococcus sp. H36-A4 TaxID=3004353 RepID=UPI0022AF80CE|nr:hypothetical protein [Rhodococcus sp. H36-A4]MCZ4078936.1 hypothetical protein [Rhodococcus sp. H36-A4]